MVRGNCLYSCIADLSTDEVSFSEAQPIFVRQVSTLSLVAMSATSSRSQTRSMGLVPEEVQRSGRDVWANVRNN